jgi:hypothetical protein
MFLTKLKLVSAVLLGIGALTLGAVALTARRSEADPPVPVAAPQARPAAEPQAKGEAGHKAVILRAPNHGIQPQVAVDGKGVVHLLYFKGDPAGGDVFYARSDDGVQFKHPLRVNSQPGSAIAVGNIRGAHLALGKNGRVHVAWNGSQKAMPRSQGKWNSPMLYARLNDAGTAFEEQRNLMQSSTTLDGGGTVAADQAGNVYVCWQAIEPDKQGEDNRRVYVAVSTDEGKTFAAEKPASTDPTGACGCCGVRAFADSKGKLYVLYRGAKNKVQRDMYLLTSADQGKSFRGEDVHPWRITLCPMSSETFAEGGGNVVGAWETDEQVYFARIDPTTGKRSAPIAAPGKGAVRKHPAVAVNAKGETILAWTEGMGWNRGGSLAWQVYDHDGNPTAERGRAAGVPVWSLIAVFVRPDGRFVVVY